MNRDDILNSSDYIEWVDNNKRYVLSYIKKNDVLLKNVLTDSRAKAILVMNKKEYLSEIVFSFEEDLEYYKNYDWNFVQEIIDFKNDYLEKNKTEIVEYVNRISDPEQMIKYNKGIGSNCEETSKNELGISYFFKFQTDIHKYAMSLLCAKEISISLFLKKYKEFLSSNKIEDNDFYFNDRNIHEVYEKIQGSRYCLCREDEYIRYYDIDGYDYTELLEVLNLRVYDNVELSTLKFINDYPNLIKKYDIRNQFELYDLLKKILDINQLETVKFTCQPILVFGEFDRLKTMKNLIDALSPITLEDFEDYLYKNFGYDREYINDKIFPPLYAYYINGFFKMRSTKIPASKVEEFKKHIRYDFNYIYDLRKKYLKYFEGAKASQINPRSLRQMGYTAYPTYMLKKHQDAKEYFKDVFLKNDDFSMDYYDLKFGQLEEYKIAVQEMKDQFEIISCGKGRYITSKLYNRYGITKEEIIAYCESIRDFVQDDSCFTVKYLKRFNIETRLSALGYGENLYNGILAESGMFSHAQMFGTYIFYKGDKANPFSKRFLFMSMLSEYEKIHIETFIEDCSYNYGIEISDKSIIERELFNTPLYYDVESGMIYHDISIIKNK